MTGQPIYLLSTGSIPEDLGKEPERGFVLDVVPFIETDYLTVEIPITGVAVFTSANAVNAIRRSITGIVPEWRIYCIGGPTYQSVVETFGEKAVAGTAESASALAGLIRQRESGQNREIVFFCGDRRRDELPSLGITEKVVYRTLLTPHRLERSYDAVAFFSPSAVESYFSVNGIQAGIPLFAIGRTTAAAIKSYCANPVIVSERPDKTLLIRMMTGYFLKKQ